jgi:hypothetical protein
MKALAGVVLAAFLLVGCATTQPVAQQPDLPTSPTFDAPKDAVWTALVQEVGLRFPVKAVEKESGLLTTDFVSMPAGFNNMNAGRWVHPPGGFLATWNGLRMSMSVLVTEPQPGKTSVNIRTHYEAFENNVSHSWVVCQSNGGLEHEILSNISVKATGTQ